MTTKAQALEAGLINHPLRPDGIEDMLADYGDQVADRTMTPLQAHRRAAWDLVGVTEVTSAVYEDRVAYAHACDDAFAASEV